MKYIMLMYGTEGLWTDQERKECMTECLSVCDRLAAQGKFIATSPLQSVTTAATVRVRDGRALITEGPFAETKEQLGGFFLLELADLDEAIAVAGKLPPVTKGTAEIRPLFELEGLPPLRPIPVGFSNSNVKPYMLLSYTDDAALREVELESVKHAITDAIALARSLNDDGRYIGASPLHPASTATCVRVRNGKRQITDGPFAETNEVLGGFYLVLAGSREEAQQIAAQVSCARRGSVEVRPLFDMAGVRELSTVS